MINLAGLALITIINESFLFSRRGLFCFIAIGLWVWLLDTSTLRYAGLSGILHGLLLLALIISRDYSEKAKALLISGLIIKAAYEQLPFYNSQPMQQFPGDRYCQYGAFIWINRRCFACRLFLLVREDSAAKTGIVMS